MHPGLETDITIWTFPLVKTLWSLVDLFSIIAYHKLKESMTHLLEVASPYFVNFLGDSDGKGSASSADSRPIPRSGRSPGEVNGYPVFLPGEFHGQKGLVEYSLWGHKESDTTEQLTFIHSFTLFRYYETYG